MMNLAYDVIRLLEGRTVATAESCTGGGIGFALTAVPGSSNVYKGGIISYTDEVKIGQLNVDPHLLKTVGAVSAEVAKAMAAEARTVLNTDIAVSVTGLAGPGGDDFGNPVGTVYIGYADANKCIAQKYQFEGEREMVRQTSVRTALQLLLEQSTTAGI